MGKKTLILFLALSSQLFAASTGQISGVVRDASNGDPLPGANVMIEGTALGAATSLDGRYLIPRVPPGDYTLVASYIGYERMEMPVRVTANETAKRDFDLAFNVVEGDTVVVTALLQGQAEAINKQLSSNTIVNVVSRDRIQELPDQNAAESLGRLPGISVQRDAGEGQKVVVRGLSPRFNSITFNGERIPSTDESDRSVDLSMISQELLAEIEVFKALTPDKDADAVGGTINFVAKKASPGWSGDMRFQYGFNNHEGEWGQVKGAFLASQRFLNNKLGAVVAGNIQNANRSSDLLNGSYLWKEEGEQRATIGVENLNLGDRQETRERYGTSLVLDYNLGSGEIVLNSLWGRTDRDELRRRKRYRVDAARTEYELRDRKLKTTLFTNLLAGDHQIGGVFLNWRGSYSTTRQEMPFSHTASFRELAAFRANLIDDQGPEFIPVGAKNNLNETFFKESAYDSIQVKDRDLTAQLDLEVPFAAGQQVSGFLKFGGKIRDKDRSRDKSRIWTSFFGINDLALDLTDNPFDLTDERKIAISNFLVPEATLGDYLNGQYAFGPILDRDKIHEFGRMYRDYRFSNGGPLYVRDGLVDLEDYNAGEQIVAGYVMASIDIGSKVLFLPGFRYEKTRNDYQSVFGNPFTNEDGQLVGALTDTTGGQNYDDWLPMFQLRIKPVSWFDIRMAATKTLSRPDYFNLVPWQRINTTERTIEQGNPVLNHTVSWNYDAYVSFYNRFGLFTVGAFYKDVEDIDYIRTTRIQGTQLNGYELTEPVNAEMNSTVKGLEFELQTNLRFLPSPFDGVVLYGNYSFISSETFFPLLMIGPRSPEPPFTPTIIDTVRSGQMPGQADDIANLTVGYEKGGFTGRFTMTYQGKILETVGARSELDGFSNSFFRLDIAIQQKVWRGFSLYLNMNNVTDRSEAAFLGIEAFPTQEEFFGWTADLGFRYRF